MTDIKRNLEKIEENIRSACKRAGRDRSEVTLIAVSKTRTADEIREALSLGISSFGENRVQELTEKADILSEETIDWHMIGHLQTNKVKYIADKVKMIHSVDSMSLATVINKEAFKRNKVIDVLAEINVAGEESKFGVSPEETEHFIRFLSGLSNLRVKGLMTVAPFTENAEKNRIYFQLLKKIMVDLNLKKIDNINMNVLSMGMSVDYTVAVEEGATMIRIGTDLFGER